MPMTNPFEVMAVIVAPSMLTNATALLVLSTSNRLARIVDRGRELSRQLEESTSYQTPQASRRLKELRAAEERTLLLLQTLQSYYWALGCFAASVLASLVGALLAANGLTTAITVLTVVGILLGFGAVYCLVRGSWLLLKETRITYALLSERVASIHARVSESGTFPRVE